MQVSAFSPEAGETAAGLSSKFPRSMLGSTLADPVPLKANGNDLYIDQAKLPAQFAADGPAKKESCIVGRASKRPN